MSCLISKGEDPLQHRVRVDLEHARRASDAQAFGQAREDADDELDRPTLAMQERPEGLQKVAATSATQPLTPGTAIGMAIGTEIAPSDPSLVRTVRVRAEMCRGVHLAAASSRHDDA